MNEFKENEVNTEEGVSEEAAANEASSDEVEAVSDPKAAAENEAAISEEPQNSEPAVTEGAPRNDPDFSKAAPNTEQGSFFGEQHFAPGQEVGYYGANGQYNYPPRYNSPNAPHAPQNFSGQNPPQQNGYYGNAQNFNQPINGAQGNYGGQQYNGNYNAPQYNSPQYGSQYAAPNYNYYGNGYNNSPQYGTPYYQPPKTPEIPAVPEEMGWQEATLKKPSKPLIIIIIILIAAMLAGVMILLAVNHRDNGDKAPDSTVSGSDKLLADREKTSKKENSGSGVTVNINVQSKPSDDESDYQDMEKGLYTTVGVAKHITPSIVTLYGYTTTTLTPYAAASGIIISEDGYIITNAHMVEGLSRIKAVTSDGGEYEADIIGYEPRCDLAVIQIHAKGLVPAELGSSEELRQGEQVIAIGNSGGYENTLTVGYVSYVNRKINSYSGYPIECIQTDAAFNTGISGGALVNMYGQVVGIPTSKSVAANDENIGFAIAMDFAAPLCEDIIENGYVTGKPRVGVLYTLIDHDTAQTLGVQPGMLISEISEDCDISRTDLQIDDIITEIDGISMTSDAALKEFQITHKAGDVVKAKVYRRTITNEESEFEITFRLEESAD